MIRNHFAVALRTLRRHRMYSAINVVGLGLSLAVGLLIVLFVRDGARYDTFHEDSGRVHRAYVDYKASINPDAHLYAMSPAALGGILEDEVPEVAVATRLRSGFGGAAAAAARPDAEPLPLSGLYAEPSFFEVFTFPLARGDARTALAEPNTVVLHDDTARRLFGDEDPLGRVVAVEGQGDFVVTGVLAPLRGKTHLPVDAVASLATVTSRPEAGEALADWTRSIYGWYTYFRLQPDVRASAVEGRMPGIIRAHFPPRDDNRLEAIGVQHVAAINFGPTLDNQLGGLVMPRAVAQVLLALAGLILLVACLNYVILTLARTAERAKEVGVRKTVGAARRHLVAQFLVEALVFAGLALVVACGLLVWLVPAFNGLWLVSTGGVPLDVDPLRDAGLYLVFAGAAVAVAVGAGLYPALRFTRVAPVFAMRGSTLGRRLGGRKGLVVMQVAVALFLVVTTLLVQRQSEYMLTADYGFDDDRLVNVRLDDVPYDVLREAALAVPGVTGVTATSLLPATGGRRDVWLSRTGLDEPVKAYNYAVAPSFFDVYGLDLLAGRPHAAGRPADADAVLLNATAVRALGLGAPEEAVGATLSLFDRSVTVIGVVEDYRSNPLAMPDSPLVLTHSPDDLAWASLRVDPGEEERVMARLEAAWAGLGGTGRAEMSLYRVQLADSFDRLLLRDARSVVGSVALLAVVIALLGLFGLAAYAAAARTKEVGIRKVLGASVANVVMLLSREFVVLSVLGIALAAPVTWFVNRQWLDGFAHRIALSAEPLVLGGVLLLGLALLVVGAQTVRAALADPAESLRYE